MCVHIIQESWELLQFFQLWDGFNFNATYFCYFVVIQNVLFSGWKIGKEYIIATYMACFCSFWNQQRNFSSEFNRFCIKVALIKLWGLDLVSAGDGNRISVHLVLHNLHSMAIPNFSLFQWKSTKFKVPAKNCFSQTLDFSIAVYLNVRMLGLVNKHL